jgi:hypothetical protein
MELGIELGQAEAFPITNSRYFPFPVSGFVSPRKLYRAFFHRRSLAILGWTLCTIYIMNCFNAFVYSRMPTGASLPDLIADAWNDYSRLRGSPSYMHSQPADMLSIFLTGLSIFSLVFFWEKTNVRKLGAVYNVSLHLRTLFFTVTGLPPACINAPNCPCAVTPWSKIARSYSVAKVAFIYTFAMGLFLNEVPQCGDLTMSGHTIYLWVLALFCMETISGVFGGCVVFLIKLVIVVLLLLVAMTIILIRNHYTIDVVLSTVFTPLFWMLYTGMQYLTHMDWKPFKTSLIGKVFTWIDADLDAIDLAESENGDPPNVL